LTAEGEDAAPEKIVQGFPWGLIQFIYRVVILPAFLASPGQKFINMSF